MEFIKGINFAPFAPKGTFERRETYQSLDKMLEETGVNYVTIVPNGLQEHAQSEDIDFTGPACLSDDELIRMINYIREKQIKVALKPTVNCKNGTWRAHISFFDKDVICEPKWSAWFKSYTDFMVHYAKIAEKSGCEMFIAGCEMVQSEHRSKEWRNVISEIREVYHKTVTYNTDKYQEDNVDWWDCVDLISSSGYYPIDCWEAELNRIKKVVDDFNKPFFFAEAGCRSCLGSQNIPNDWKYRGEVNLPIQAKWYEKMFEACSKAGFVNGFMLWSWPAKLYPEKSAASNDGYEFYAKPACKVIRDYYM